MADYLYAWDPGATTGVCIRHFSPDMAYKIVKLTNFGMPELYDVLPKLAEEYPPQLVIIEEYKIFPQYLQSHRFSDVLTLRIIGALEYWSYINHAKVEFQAPSIKKIGYKFQGIPVPTSKVTSHYMDALVHSTYFLVTNKLMEAPSIEKIRTKMDDKIS